MTSAEQTFEGAIEIADPGGRPAVSGTLAAETLALEPLLGPPQRLFDSSGGWSAKPFALTPPQAFDLDLRLSASRLDVYGRKLTDAAASVMVTHGKLSMNLIDAAAYGGRLNGEAALTCVDDDLKLSARGELSDADLGAAVADFGRPTVTGRGAARFSARDLRRFARRRRRRLVRNGGAGGGGRRHRRRQPRGGAAPQPTPANRRRARHAPRRNGVRQARRLVEPRQRPR